MTILDPRLIAAFKNPTMEAAMELWDVRRFGEPIADAPLAGVHKARVRWPDATKKQVQESKRWLADNGYSDGLNGPDPTVPKARVTRLTPRT